MFRRCIEWAATIANRETYNSIRQLSLVKCCNSLATMLAYGAAAAADTIVSSRSWDTSPHGTPAAAEKYAIDT